jgi:hypothetical protein
MGSSHNHHHISDNNTDPLTIFDVKKYLYCYYLSVLNTSPQNANYYYYYYYYCINNTIIIIIIITDATYELLVITKLM